MKQEKKQTYEKPVLRVIELAAEETLVLGCKMAVGGIPARSNPGGCIGLNHCSGKGS